MKFEVDSQLYAATEIDSMVARGETKTDRDRLATSAPLTDDQFARMVADDPDLAVPANWESAIVLGVPPTPGR